MEFVPRHFAHYLNERSACCTACSASRWTGGHSLWVLTADDLHGVGGRLVGRGDFEARLLGEQTDANGGLVGLLPHQALHDAPEVQTLHLLQGLLVLSHRHLQRLGAPDSDLSTTAPWIRGIATKATQASGAQEGWAPGGSCQCFIHRRRGQPWRGLTPPSV